MNKKVVVRNGSFCKNYLSFLLMPFKEGNKNCKKLSSELILRFIDRNEEKYKH